MMGLVLIFIAKTVEVSITTIRTVFISRGEKVLASLIGFIEILIWLKVASVVLGDIEGNIDKMIVYALGFSCGNYIGLLIEDKLGLGYSNVQVITSSEDGKKLSDGIRSLGYAVTISKAEGRDSERTILSAYVKRKHKDNIVNCVRNLNVDGVVTVSETQKIYGGFGIH